MKRAIVLILVLVVGLLLLINHANAQGEPTYLGEVCFFIFNEIAGAPPETANLSVLSYGAGRFVLNGRWVGAAPVHGSAAVDDNKIVISLNSTYVTGTPSTGSFMFYHIVLDATTLSGNYTQIGFGITDNTSNIVQPFIRTGGVARASCQ